MTKKKFFAILNKNLKDLSVHERQNALELYENHFLNAENDKQAIHELPHPKTIATRLLKDAGIKVKKPFSAIGLIVLILASPLIFIAFIAFITLFITLLFTVVVILLILGAISFFAIIAIPESFTLSLATGLMCLGASLISTPMLILVLISTYYSFKLNIKMIKKLMNKKRSCA